MRWFLIAIAILGVGVFPRPAASQCPGPDCPAPTLPATSSPYEWKQDDEEHHWYGLFHGKVQIAAFNSRTQRLYLYDPANDRWVESSPPARDQAQSTKGTVPVTNGVVRSMIKPEGERFSLNGRDISPREAMDSIDSTDRIPDDAKAPSLTLIGPKDQTKRVRDEMEKSPLLGPLVKRMLLQEYEASNPMVSKSGFKTGGQPTIYAELPDGQVLFRLDEYPGDQAMVRSVIHALQVSEGIRKPDPNYVPANDPGLTLPVKPQIKADVSPEPWQLVLSHLAIFFAGGITALVVVLGGGLAAKKLVSSAIRAEMAAATPPVATAGQGGVK